MTFTLVSIYWDGMKYVLQKRPLGSLRFSPPSDALPARLLRSLALSTLPSSCARGPGPAPCSSDLLLVRSCSMSPRVARCEAASAALLASRLARPPVGAPRASHPWYACGAGLAEQLRSFSGFCIEWETSCLAGEPRPRPDECARFCASGLYVNMRTCVAWLGARTLRTS